MSSLRPRLKSNCNKNIKFSTKARHLTKILSPFDNLLDAYQPGAHTNRMLANEKYLIVKHQFFNQTEGISSPKEAYRNTNMYYPRLARSNEKIATKRLVLPPFAIENPH